MNGIPMDFLQSFDQLKALNLSGNHLVNSSLALLDHINSLEVSFLWLWLELYDFFSLVWWNMQLWILNSVKISNLTPLLAWNPNSSEAHWGNKAEIAFQRCIVVACTAHSKLNYRGTVLTRPNVYSFGLKVLLFSMQNHSYPGLTAKCGHKMYSSRALLVLFFFYCGLHKIPSPEVQKVIKMFATTEKKTHSDTQTLP